MNQKWKKLLFPHFGQYFLLPAAFSALSAAAGYYTLAAVELAVTALLFAVYLRSDVRRRQTVNQRLEEMGSNLSLAAKDSMLVCPLPVVMFQPETDDVLWSNDQFLSICGAKERIFDTKLSDLLPDFDTRWLLEGKSLYPEEVRLCGRRYRIYGQLSRTDDNSTHALATTYWLDVTDLSEAKERYVATRPVVALLLLDNYEDTLKGIDESVRARILSEVNNEIKAWIEGSQGMYCRLDRDRYLLITEESDLSRFIEDKFSILDKVHTNVSPSGLPVTLSIGVGVDADGFGKLYENAALSLDMALSRGGDQAVIKNRFTFEFYGGRSKETEKRTKVKSRVMANALGKLVADASRIIVMGHKFPDMDAIGAAAGVCAISRKYGVESCIVVESENNPATPVITRLKELPEYSGIFQNEQDALLHADADTLLVVVDTNRPEQVPSRSLLESCNKVAVIDHHRRAATYIEGAALNFHEPYASSASELVTEVISYLMDPSDLLKGEAEALMSGLMLDTKNFTSRTGGRTFEAAAFLRRSGADTGVVKRFFQNNLEDTLAKYDLIRTAKMYYGSIAIAAANHPVARVTAAQAADELLNIAGVKASFVLCANEDRTIVSARSTGAVNVQVVLESLGGGGNAAVAGAQIPHTTVEEAVKMLNTSLDRYFADENESD